MRGFGGKRPKQIDMAKKKAPTKKVVKAKSEKVEIVAKAAPKKVKKVTPPSGKTIIIINGKEYLVSATLAAIKVARGTATLKK